ncbi:MAG: endonuclease domain-containing protein [Ignavibacteriales bacterium]|nr:endonuclease domain-containing protein [Ignavibacteriales bacterium]
MSIFVSKELRRQAIERSRELRRKQTPAEEKLWEFVRDYRAFHVKVRRQHPVYYEDEGKTSFYIADFLITEANLIIEIDGEIHNYQVTEDKRREEILNNLGFKVIRFTNKQINEEIKAVLKAIEEELKQTQESFAANSLSCGRGQG